MSLKPRLEPWASAGDRIDGGSSWRANGWTYLHRPERQYWNDLEYKRDVLINGLADSFDFIGTFPPQADYVDLCSRIGDVQWSDPTMSPNYLNTGSDIRDSCIGWDFTNNRAVLYVLQSDEVFPVDSCWQYDSDPSLGTALALTYGSTPDEVHAICSDGDFLYVVWSLNAGNVWVSKYNMASFTGTPVWNADTGLTDASVADSKIRAIVANASNIAVILPSNSEPAAPTIAIINKSSAVVSTGSGTGTGADFHYERFIDLISDGTTVFWVSAVPAGTISFYLNSADIASPSSSSYSRFAIATALTTANYHQHPTGIAALRGDVIALSYGGNVYCCDLSSSTTVPLFNISNMDPYTLSGTVGVGTSIGDDRSNLWLFSAHEFGFEAKNTFFKIPHGRLEYEGRWATAPDIECRGIYTNLIDYDDEKFPGRLLFDGQDMWFASTTGHILRICNPGGR